MTESFRIVDCVVREADESKASRSTLGDAYEALAKLLVSLFRSNLTGTHRMSDTLQLVVDCRRFDFFRLKG